MTQKDAKEGGPPSRRDQGFSCGGIAPPVDTRKESPEARPATGAVLGVSILHEADSLLAIVHPDSLRTINFKAKSASPSDTAERKAPKHRCHLVAHGLHPSGNLADESTSSSGWHRTFGMAVLISLGSILVLFPAWLPRNPALPVEDGAVELLQLAMLSMSAAFLLATASHAGRFRPIYLGMSAAAMAAAVAEFEDALGAIFPSHLTKWLFLPFLVVAAWFFATNRRETLRFTALAARHPASGFIAAALILIYVFSRFFGSKAFWSATLEAEFDPDLPRICRGYLELVSCYFIFVGVIGFCLPVRRRESPAA